MPVKTIQFIYTMQNKILTIAAVAYTKLLNYDMINNQILKVYIKPNNTNVTN